MGHPVPAPGPATQRGGRRVPVRPVRRGRSPPRPAGCGWAAAHGGCPYARAPGPPPRRRGGAGRAPAAPPRAAPRALPPPRIAVVVVAERLPEARLVLGHENEAAHPLGA